QPLASGAFGKTDAGEEIPYVLEGIIRREEHAPPGPAHQPPLGGVVVTGEPLAAYARCRAVPIGRRTDGLQLRDRLAVAVVPRALKQQCEARLPVRQLRHDEAR